MIHVPLTVVDTVELDIDNDQEKERVEIIQAGTKRALAARWRKLRSNGEEEQIWALADRLIVDAKSSDRLQDVQATVSQCLKNRGDLQFLTSPPAEKAGLAYTAVSLQDAKSPGSA